LTEFLAKAQRTQRKTGRHFSLLFASFAPWRETLLPRETRTMSAVLDQPEAPPVGVVPRLSGLFRRYWVRILGVYGLFNVENLVRLAQPIVLGWAIDGLLRGSWLGVILLAAQHFVAMILTSSRQAIDTRVFAGIYADMVSEVVIDQRGRDVPTGVVAA